MVDEEKQEKKVKSTKKIEEKPKVIEPEISEIEEIKRKSESVDILVSVMRYNDKIISALGVPSNDMYVSHKLFKNKLKMEEIFNIINAIKNNKELMGSKHAGEWELAISQSIDNRFEYITMPSEHLSKINKNPIGNLQHELLSIKLELFLK